MLRAIRKIFGDAKAELASGYIVVGNSEGYASNVPMGGKVTIDPAGSIALAASVVGNAALKYKNNTFSLKGDDTSATSVTATITTNGKFLGYHLTKLTSYTNLPIITQGASAITVSTVGAFVGTDVCEGVIVTIEP